MIQILPISKTTYSKNAFTWKEELVTEQIITGYTRDEIKLAEAKKLFKTVTELEWFEAMLSHTPEFLAEPVYEDIQLQKPTRILADGAIELDYTYDELDVVLNVTKWFEQTDGKWALVDIPQSELDRRTEEKRKDGISLNISAIKTELSASDYQAIKYAEGLISESDYAPIKAARQALRDKINVLDTEIANLNI